MPVELFAETCGHLFFSRSNGGYYTGGRLTLHTGAAGAFSPNAQRFTASDHCGDSAQNLTLQRAEWMISKWLALLASSLQVIHATLRNLAMGVFARFFSDADHALHRDLLAEHCERGAEAGDEICALSP